MKKVQIKDILQTKVSASYLVVLGVCFIALLTMIFLSQSGILSLFAPKEGEQMRSIEKTKEGETLLSWSQAVNAPTTLQGTAICKSDGRSAIKLVYTGPIPAGMTTATIICLDRSDGDRQYTDTLENSREETVAGLPAGHDIICGLVKNNSVISRMPSTVKMLNCTGGGGGGSGQVYNLVGAAKCKDGITGIELQSSGWPPNDPPDQVYCWKDGKSEYHSQPFPSKNPNPFPLFVSGIKMEAEEYWKCTLRDDGVEISRMDNPVQLPNCASPCKKEGETIPVIADPPSCCSGLTKIPPKDPNTVGISGICTAKCGNGTCDTATESNYNCPKDCPKQCFKDSECESLNMPTFCEFASCSPGNNPGQCVQIPNLCPTLYDPVCGCDNKTYANDCVRQIAKVSKKHDEKCSATCQISGASCTNTSDCCTGLQCIDKKCSAPPSASVAFAESVCQNDRAGIRFISGPNPASQGYVKIECTNPDKTKKYRDDLTQYPKISIGDLSYYQTGYFKDQTTYTCTLDNLAGDIRTANPVKTKDCNKDENDNNDDDDDDDDNDNDSGTSGSKITPSQPQAQVPGVQETAQRGGTQTAGSAPTTGAKTTILLILALLVGISAGIVYYIKTARTE